MLFFLLCLLSGMCNCFSVFRLLCVVFLSCMWIGIRWLLMLNLVSVGLMLLMVVM